MLQQGEVESHGVQYAILSSRTEDKSGWETDVTAEQSAGGAALRRPGYRRRRRRFHSSLAQVVRPEIFFIPSTAPTPEA